MFDVIIIHDTVCCYFHPAAAPPFNNLKPIPLREMIKFMKNFKKIDFKKTNELCLRICFKKCIPTPSFDMVKEIEKIDSFSRSKIFKRLFLKRVFVSIRYIKSGFPQLNKAFKNSHKLGISRGEPLSPNKIFSEYLPQLVLFHDKWLVLTMKEVIGILTVSKFAQKFLNSAPSDAFSQLAYLISDNNLLKTQVFQGIVETQSEKIVDMDHFDDNFSVNNESLFNFSVKSSQSGFSFNFSNLNSNID